MFYQDSKGTICEWRHKNKWEPTTFVQQNALLGTNIAAVYSTGAKHVVLFFQDRAALQGNMQAKYPEVTEVANVEQTGMSFTADLTFEDGTTAERELIMVEPDGEPFFGRDILARPGNPEPLRSPGK